MPKDVKCSIMQLRVGALTFLVVASTIAAAAFFAESADASENANNPYLMETTYETTEMPEESGSPATGEHRSPNTGQDGGYTGSDIKYCYIVLAFDDVVPEIHPSNTIRVDADICNEIGQLIMSHVYDEV